MAMELFRAPALPNPPALYDMHYVRQLVRVIELYFSQLDSQTPLSAESFNVNGVSVTESSYRYSLLVS